MSISDPNRRLEWTNSLVISYTGIRINCEKHELELSSNMQYRTLKRSHGALCWQLVGIAEPLLSADVPHKIQCKDPQFDAPTKKAISIHHVTSGAR